MSHSTYPDELYLAPTKSCRGDILLPGSKSIANRALLMAALCDGGTTELDNLLDSDDTQFMRQALTALGVAHGTRQQSDKDLAPTPESTIANLKWQVTGCGGHWPQQPSSLYLGNAGTAMRPLLAVLALTWQGGPLKLHGEPRMHERPLGPLLSALRSLGCELECEASDGYPPIIIRPRQSLAAPAKVKTLSIDGSLSSQFISALLMALPLAPHDTELTLTGEIVSRPYIELTIAMLAKFGIEIVAKATDCYVIRGQQRYQSPRNYWIEGDASAASYWLAAGVLGQGPVTVHGAGFESLQGDVGFAEVLIQMGAAIQVAAQRMTARGVRQPLQGIDVDLNHIPDAAMTLAPLALFAKGPTRIRNVANWRLKETDRLAAMATELRKTGADVELHADGLTITPPQHWQAATIDTYNDHRMAMCFALLSFAPTGVTIRDPSCCRKTYPDFFALYSQHCHE